MRYRIGSLRPGTVVHTPTGFVQTNAIDGGATLTKEQIAFFKAGGYDLTAVRGEAPAPPEEQPDPDAVAEAARIAADANRNMRDGLKPLRKRSHLDQRRR